MISVDFDNRAFLHTWNLHFEAIIGHILPPNYGDQMAKMDHIHHNGNIYRIWDSIFLLLGIPMWLLLQYMGLFGTKNDEPALCCTNICIGNGICAILDFSYNRLDLCHFTSVCLAACAYQRPRKVHCILYPLSCCTVSSSIPPVSYYPN
jgi:hypothetical protein